MVTYDWKLLSNAHVIAMNGSNFLAIGTPIIQPGPYDWGTLQDRVGKLEKYIKIKFPDGNVTPINRVDAAIGSIDAGIGASPGELFSETGNYWILGWTEVSVGDIVRKSGRTTGVTAGEVLLVNAFVRVGYRDRVAYFDDQILVRLHFARPGDSGSVVDKAGKFVGLVFAGAIDGYPNGPGGGPRHVVVCKARHIIAALGIAVEDSGGGGGDGGGHHEILVAPGTHPLVLPGEADATVDPARFGARHLRVKPIYADDWLP